MCHNTCMLVRITLRVEHATCFPNTRVLNGLIFFEMCINNLVSKLNGYGELLTLASTLIGILGETFF